MNRPCKFCGDCLYSTSDVGEMCHRCFSKPMTCKICERNTGSLADVGENSTNVGMDEKMNYRGGLCGKCLIIKAKIFECNPKYAGLAHKDYLLRVTYSARYDYTPAYASEGESEHEEQENEEIVYPLFIKIKNADLYNGRYLDEKSKYYYLYNDRKTCSDYTYSIIKAKVIRRSELIDLPE